MASFQRSAFSGQLSALSGQLSVSDSGKVECLMNLACSEDELKQLLNDVAFTRNFGFVLHRIDDGQCTIDVTFQDAFERPGGIVSGQVFMATADVAMWLAIKTSLAACGNSRENK
jgi:acyl-coenzyme A thioesterase PaaI-like protein